MKKLLVTALLSMSLISCASITGPGNQQVKIETTPPGAEIIVDGQTQVSPALVTLKGKSDYTVMARKDGYRDAYGKINGEPRILAGVVGNIFNLTGIIGMAVDFLGTGAAYKLDNNVSLVLDKK